MSLIVREDAIARRSLVLTALGAEALDRIRLMKTLFLAWHRSGRPANWPFRFEPYSYGPWSRDVYTTLETLQQLGLVLQLPEGDNKGRYFLTSSGKREAARIGINSISAGLPDIARWAARQSFDSLLATVYREAPDFATRSVVAKQVMRS